MRRSVTVAAAVCLAAGLLPSGTAQAQESARHRVRPTHVKVKSWHVYTSDHVLHVVKPGRTFKFCTGNPMTELDAKGKVKRAKKGGAFTETWTRNGAIYDQFSSSWSKGGKFTDYFGQSSATGLSSGTWRVKLTTPKGKRIGSAKIVVVSKTC